MTMNTPNKKIILTGGGTGGSVTPLLALVDDIRAGGSEPVWVGTYDGVEKKLVSESNLPYYPVASGKLRRYFSLRNISDPIFILLGFFQSLVLLARLKPRLIITAGSFVSVPVVWAAWTLGIRIIVHQQDIRPGLANKLMAPFANVVTVTFEKSLKDFGKKAVWTGNPIRPEFKLANEKAKQQDRGEEAKLPTVLVVGGGTGSQTINDLVLDSLAELTTFCRIIHITGVNQTSPLPATEPLANYERYMFLDAVRLADAMAKADIVVTRAGIGMLTELAYLAKPIIVIPMPHSHQEDNARYFSNAEAAVLLEQKDLTPDAFTKAIMKLVEDKSSREASAERISSLIKPDANIVFNGLIRRLTD